MQFNIKDLMLWSNSQIAIIHESSSINSNKLTYEQEQNFTHNSYCYTMLLCYTKTMMNLKYKNEYLSSISLLNLFLVNISYQLFYTITNVDFSHGHIKPRTINIDKPYPNSLAKWCVNLPASKENHATKSGWIKRLTSIRLKWECIVRMNQRVEYHFALETNECVGACELMPIDQTVLSTHPFKFGCATTSDCANMI